MPGSLASLCMEYSLQSDYMATLWYWQRESQQVRLDLMEGRYWHSVGQERSSYSGVAVRRHRLGVSMNAALHPTHGAKDQQRRIGLVRGRGSRALVSCASIDPGYQGPARYDPPGSHMAYTCLHLGCTGTLHKYSTRQSANGSGANSIVVGNCTNVQELTFQDIPLVGTTDLFGHAI